jgi:hypothetical protein
LDDNIHITIWLDDNIKLPSGWMVTLRCITIWLDDCIIFFIWCYHLAVWQHMYMLPSEWIITFSLIFGCHLAELFAITVEGGPRK